jgi:hypothetical protein
MERTSTMSRTFSLIPVISAALAAALWATTTPAAASTDSKIVSGTICQPDRAEDAKFLRYLARGLHADISDLTKEVNLTCPLLRDSTLSKLVRVELRFARGFTAPTHGQTHSLFTGPFEATLLNCSETELINNPCAESTHRSPKSFDQEVERTVPLIFEGSHLPKGQDGTYSVKLKLPKGTVLRTIRYKEDVN